MNPLLTGRPDAGQGAVKEALNDICSGGSAEGKKSGQGKGCLNEVGTEGGGKEERGGDEREEMLTHPNKASSKGR